MEMKRQKIENNLREQEVELQTYHDALLKYHSENQARAQREKMINVIKSNKVCE